MANHYVDFSATNNGDGTTAAQAGSPGGVGAFNTIVGITPVAGDSYWIRRSGTLTVAAAYTLSVAANFIGWPISGDTFYATRPASGTSNGWDADTQTYAQVTCSTNSLGSDYFTISGSGADVERMKWTMTAGTQTTAEALAQLAANCTINNCYFLNTVQGAATMYGVALTSATVLVSNTIVEFSFACTAANTFHLVRATGSGVSQFRNCTFTFSNATSTATTGIQNVEASPTGSGSLLFDTCTFVRNCVTAVADMVSALGAASSATNSLFMYNCTITDTSSVVATNVINTGANIGTFVGSRLTIIGSRISIIRANHYCHCSSFSQSIYSTDYAVNLAAGSTFVCNNFFESAGNTSGAINGQNGSNIYLQNTSFISTNPFGPPSTIISNIYETDSRGIFGYFKYTSPKGTITSSSINRTGGRNYSLLFFPTSGGVNDLLQFRSMNPSFETIFASLAPGNTTITIYGAYKGYSPVPDSSQIWAECDYISAAVSPTRAFADSGRVIGTALTSDASTWTGDSGLTMFKLVITVAPLQSCLAPIRIYTNLSQVTAYFYIDPLPVVV